jgi:hypothetical protein
MISEGLVTSTNEDGSAHFAPLGPVVDLAYSSLLLRPFQPSTTFDNLSRTRCGVFHILDDVELIARCVTRTLHTLPEVFPALQINGWVLETCCQWLEFEITSIDDSSPRSEMQARIVHREQRRPFWGYNRARHALLELCILATRTHLLPQDEIRSAWRYFRPVIQRTAGETELHCLELITEFLQSELEDDLHA